MGKNKGDDFMGMPVITPGTGTRDQAITDLIQSVALQEAALSHMLNAEGEKMQAIIAMPDATLEDLMNMNESVNKLVNAVTRLEMMFLSKLELFADQSPPAPTDAAAELANISVTSVTIPVPLNDPTAEQYAVNQAVAAAQAQVDPGYTVSFTPTSYDGTTGTLTGTFTVVNNNNPADTATDTADRTIAVVYTPSTATATSNSAAQFISGTLLSGDLSPIAGIGGVTAQYINGVTTGTSVTNTTNLDITALGQTPVVINSITMPLSDFLQLGAVNQYAQASVDGASRAFSGAVDNNGVVSIGGSAAFPANAELDLMQVLPSTPALSTANMTIGAINGAAQWSASVGNTIASTTDVTNPVQGRTYNIDDATLNLVSPLAGDLVTAIDTAAGDASQAVSNLGSDVINGLLNGVNNILTPLNALVPGLSILSNDLSVQVSLVDLQTELAPILATPITSGDGAVTVDFSAGTISVDLGQLLGINNLPPNTPLLSSTVINSIITDLSEVVQALQATVENLIMSKLNGTAAVTISGGIDLLDVLGVPTAGLDISYDGTLGDLMTNTQPLVVTGTGTLAPFSSAIAPLIATLQTDVGTVLNPLINEPSTGIVSVANAAVAAALTSFSNQLSPVFSLISSVISIIVNVQEDNVDGANTFTEIPVQLNLLNDATTLNLGKVVVGPNTYTP